MSKKHEQKAPLRIEAEARLANMSAEPLAATEDELPSVFRLPRSGVHATSFSFC